MFALLANLVLVLHLALVIFVIAGLALTVIGNWRQWPWVNHFGFRAAHLATIGIVVAESWLGITCPLTTLESWLRAQAGQSRQQVDFIQYWLQQILFFEAPAWAFTTAYSLFGTLVLLSWWKYPPRRARRVQIRESMATMRTV